MYTVRTREPRPTKDGLASEAALQDYNRSSVPLNADSLRRLAVIDQSPSTYRFACLAGQNWAKMRACVKVIYWTNPDDWITGLSYRALLICDSKFVENRPRESLH